MEGATTKCCPRCGETKALEAFAKRRGNGRQSYCQACVRLYQRGRPRVLLAKRLVRGLKNRPCSDSGVQYPHYVLDFDHRPGEIKLANLKVLVKQGAAKDVLLAEIAKCDLVCANCHRVRTFRRRRQSGEADEERDTLL